MSHAAQMEFLRALAKALAAQFGPNCEVAVHDLRAQAPERPIVAIENGHVTGRKVGDGPSHAVLEALKGEPAALQDRLAYLTRTKAGKVLKSSTVFFRDDDGSPAAILDINYDVTLLLTMEENLRRFAAADQPKKASEPANRNVADLLDELIAQSVALVGKPAALMTREEKVMAIRFLNDTGAFLITKSGDKVCKHFGISKYTLYSYIDEAKSS